jgi:hypothetical protein
MLDATHLWDPDKDKLYSELCSTIRATDDISFKLLGFVPVLSGSAIFLLLFKGDSLAPATVILLCAVGAVITFGLFCWERRNVNTCKLFREAVSQLEELMPAGWLKPYSILAKKMTSEKYSSSWGKTESEVLIYITSILVWTIPVINLVLQKAK